jgi:hypothetical protein
MRYEQRAKNAVAATVRRLKPGVGSFDFFCLLNFSTYFHRPFVLLLIKYII